MDSKSSKFHALTGSLARHVFFRALFLASAVSLVSLVRFLPTLELGSLTPKTYVDCVHDSDSVNQNTSLNAGSYLFQSRILNTFWGSFDSIKCQNHTALTSTVIAILKAKRLLNYGAKTLCIGQGSNIVVSTMQRFGFSTVAALNNHAFFSPNNKNFVSHFEYKDSSFDFVFSKDVDKVSVPALLVLEVERILKPGGIGVLLIDSSSSSSVFSLITCSTVVHVGYVNELSLVIFKKTSENSNTNTNSTSLFYNRVLPEDCASVAFTKPLVELMEPLVEERARQDVKYERSVSYLPNLVDVSGRKRMVYIDIGVRDLVNADVDVSDWFPPSYPIHLKAFSVYFVHYNVSVLSYVKRPRVTFVYHPGLAGRVADNVDMDPLLGEEEFDFLMWFKETVQNADFVVLKMNVGDVEMKFLADIFESGTLCFVDELFLGCSESEDGKDEIMSSREQCMDIYKGLRSNGVYVHQWWDTRSRKGPQKSYVQ
ncbi:hypothetical protein PHAVU_007G221200 [Phaseolus vulgaris]|uniref:DUF7870 domain-containing protein n=1 Tax=Phaseolus vulgaris TaxID=3885 RepID=V7BJK6_PHAVU|nr:hypothetical protein PHAVU_007G221200g [Phaseolus vulgaris]ESW17220.1 hypothetical protein PHAVU_007G221200g [Phaseolus vulgaris]